jgi:hypothetical protein
MLGDATFTSIRIDITAHLQSSRQGTLLGELLVEIRCLNLTAIATLTSALQANLLFAGPVYDLAADFSASSNPSGVWTYGYSTSLGAAFNVFGTTGNVSGIDVWTIDTSTPTPTVNHNGTGSPITDGTITWAAGQVGFHPGPNGQNAIIRFTAPNDANLSLQASFAGLDFVGPTSTDVHILLNNVSLFDGSVNTFGSGPSFASTLFLHAGDILDFAVGFGDNGTYYSDSTGIQATLSPNAVPEPSSLVMLATGSLAFGLIGWFRRSNTTQPRAVSVNA